MQKSSCGLSRLTKLRCRTAALMLAGAGFALAPSLAQGAGPPLCPNPPAASIASPQVPADVTSFPGGCLPINFFDDFSWKAFVALVWPSLAGQRGAPDPNAKIGDAAKSVVFETYKADWEVFQPGGKQPSEWNSFDATNPCPAGTPVNPGDLVLAYFTKFANLGQAGLGNLVSTLVSQNGKYVRYQAAFNQLEYDLIRTREFYLFDKLPAAGTPFAFPNGSIDIKTSWIEMWGVTNPERFHTRTVWLASPDGASCSQTLVGLVGLHIVVKTPTRPQWIWATFEHVDNVPTPGGNRPGPFTFNRGSDQQPGVMPASVPEANKFNNATSVPPPPFNVQRKPQNTIDPPIHTSTQATNKTYQGLLNGTVWKNYQLVMTQWPTLNPPDPSKPGSPANTFPGTGPVSAYANTTMETWDQVPISKGCMACHTVANAFTKNTDFLWSLHVNAFRSGGPSPLSLRTGKPAKLPPDLEALKALLSTRNKK